MSETPKYKILETNPYDLEEQINELATQGYKLHTFATRGTQLDCVAIMYLSELDSKYIDVINLKDVPPHEVDNYLADGWIVASASISTKFVRMVKKK